ncbi:tRNA (adenosine(37)-N6)-threonylcarbamoyltransferase complex dimerization subunit type 1 TsaB [Adhaeribacter rhizoryzae]|uniref:tRNA (Adenosine(37)-N6)-threonylcarbamoyltransferase complex dimerization subunit type 1 TsaB n=1 Tax=Adhaeribacter rhizoryzae TaxID=2607907 RepID=A0A5M6DJF8_9BACT|nr:tRNA (adenosine(37)-N6)-threonylcarbamoyltransferase complex dimerization subunit type 1 TsaB [Adhaeribacter rhizoryzae]KAA5547583.1 tRNA (adenosine(37)-N6)-threonylcarbamoyltransferase complex dimerization subunit type 1 TsaB [Adhaeribacter rhizoryzae]
MAVLLALETSSTVCSVALFKNGQLLGVSELQIEKSHSSHITVLIEQLLQNCQVNLKDLAAIAISGGPGSYTGLRIGSATAKGLCYSLSIPLIEVSTLDAIAAKAIGYTPKPENYLYCPMIDARRMEVYTTITNHNLEALVPVAPLVLEKDSFKPELAKHKIIFCGSGVAKFKHLVEEPANAYFLEHVKPSADLIGKLALSKLEQNIFQNVAYYEPFYLKEVYITSSAK